MPTSFAELVADAQPLDASVNAALDYAAAAQLIDEAGPALRAFASMDMPGTNASSQERSEWLKVQAKYVAEQSAAIERVTAVDGRIRPAVERVEADFGTWTGLKAQLDAGEAPPDPADLLLPALNPLRELTYLLAADIRVSAAAGDAERSLRQAIRLFGLADAIDADARLSPEHRTASAIRAHAARTLIDVAGVVAGPGVANQSKETAISLLLDDAPERAAWRRTLAGEIAFNMEVLRAIEEGRIELAELVGSCVPTRGGRLRSIVAAPVLRGDAAKLADLMRRWHASGDIPTYPAAQVQISRDGYIARGSVFDMFADLLLRSLAWELEFEYRNRAERRLAAAALAVAWYRADHDGEWPTSLQSLVPRYLPETPRDPMAVDAPLRYDSARRLLWSIGTDGIDHGGDATSFRGDDVEWRWAAKDTVIRLELPDT